MCVVGRASLLNWLADVPLGRLMLLLVFRPQEMNALPMLRMQAAAMRSQHQQQPQQQQRRQRLQQQQWQQCAHNCTLSLSYSPSSTES